MDRYGQLPCGCYEGEGCPMCAPWGPDDFETTEASLARQRAHELRLAAEAESEVYRDHAAAL